MILKSLSITGFKSFADKTNIQLSNNLNVVVGPNGSGKSNIVDAVAWVLGTQSPGALRTNKMEDVIFAGTSKLQEKGFAEVQLVFDGVDSNESSKEFSISRKLYRDGTSEYFMNGLNCRLLDLQDFLISNGIGKQQHTIVSQGQITNILNAKADEHRETLEEASGVLPLKLKKEKALRRIEAGEKEVKRAKDVLREIKKQIKPLELQAQQASQHEELVKRLKRLKFIKEIKVYEILDSELRNLTLDQDDIKNRISQYEKDIENKRIKKSSLKTEVGDGGNITRIIKEHTGKLYSMAEQYTSIAQIANERINYKEQEKIQTLKTLTNNQKKLEDNNLSLSTLSSRLIEKTKDINEIDKELAIKEKDIIKLEKIIASSREVSEAIIDKDIEYLESKIEEKNIAYDSHLKQKILWEADKNKVEEVISESDHELNQKSFRVPSFNKLVRILRDLFLREVHNSNVELEKNRTEKEQIIVQLEEKNNQLIRYKKSNFKDIKRNSEDEKNILNKELDDLKQRNKYVTGEVIKLKEQIGILTSQNEDLNNILRNSKKQDFSSEIVILEEVSLLAKKYKTDIELAIESLEKMSDKYSLQYGQSDSQLTNIDEDIEVLYRNISDLKEKSGSMAIQYGEISAKLVSSKKILNEEYNIDDPSGTVSSLDDLSVNETEVEIEKLEKSISEIGNVNYLAKEDYESLQSRLSTMTSSLEDLHNAKKKLLKHIQDIDEEMSLRLETAFNSVSVHFSEIFKILFPGGKGTLSLTNEKNILDSGIEINAQPRGKKIKKISLLSGGERSLAALAFLFSIFRSYPSPFYILDEVEAALDDANLHRMLDLLNDFKNDAQFIIVTHQQQTMQVGDVLYGVTMEPGAGSRIFVKSKKQFEELISENINE